MSICQLASLNVLILPNLPPSAALNLALAPWSIFISLISISASSFLNLSPALSSCLETDSSTSLFSSPFAFAAVAASYAAFADSCLVNSARRLLTLSVAVVIRESFALSSSVIPPAASTCDINPVMSKPAADACNSFIAVSASVMYCLNCPIDGSSSMRVSRRTIKPCSSPSVLTNCLVFSMPLLNSS